MFFLFITVPALADVPTMTVSEIQPGMHGIGKTVIQGTEIREFDVEVINVFRSMGFNGGPLILIRISGDVVDASGGIAGGYSGSPIYIDGKLIGAVSWGAYYTEGDVCGATPIHEMLRAWTYPDEEPVRIGQAPECLDAPIELGERTVESIYLADYGDDPAQLQDIYGDETLIMKPCATPLIVSGLSQRGFDSLNEFAKDKLPYMELVQGPGSSMEDGVPTMLGPVNLEGGASIGAQLATGDLDLTAVGTLTWVGDDGRFLAFGHPFLSDGETNLPFITTEILFTMPAMDRSYKMGQPLEVVGTVTQDRLSCIAGQLGMVPDLVDFHMQVVDRDIDRTRNFDYSVINKEDWLPMLGMMLPMEGLVFGSDRSGPGTVKVGFSIYGEGLENPITRENLVWGDYDTSMALGEFMQALSMLTTGNSYREIKLTRVEINVEITSARQTMDITRARFNNAPNMGPGAQGYTGPSNDEADKVEKDSSINNAALWLQQAPYPYDQSTYMNGMPMAPGYDATMGMASNLVKYHPGDTIELLVTLRPYRQDTIQKVIDMVIPDDFPVGQTSIEIMGGSSSGMYGMGYYYDPSMDIGSYYYMPPENLDESIKAFEEMDPYNSIVIELLRLGSTDPYYYLQDNYKEPEPVKTVMMMDDVIYGYYSLPIEIVGEDYVDESGMDGEYTDETMTPNTDMGQEPEPRPRSRNPYRDGD
ncbi:MAG: hypothetical protein NTY09_10180 [bacterium]|nr:hypothetical protein [bacterium]